MTNLKLVLRAYSALRQMSPDDIALLETLRALNESDRELLLETMAGKTTTKTAVTGKRKIERCEACDYTRRAIHHNNPEHADYHEFVLAKKAGKKSSQSSSKSPRASGMAAQLKERRQEQRDKTTTITDDEHCMYELSYGPCLQAADANIHHLRNHPNYHEFTVGESAAPPAPAPSPANGGVGGSIANSGVETENASTATGG